MHYGDFELQCNGFHDEPGLYLMIGGPSKAYLLLN